MSERTSSVDLIAGQLWTHDTHGYTVVTTRVTEDHVHYEFWDEEPVAHAEAAREFIREQFGHSLAYIAPQAGGCADPDAFAQEFTYHRERPRDSYESASDSDSDSNAGASTDDADETT